MCLSVSSSEEYEDVIFLKDGSIIYGIIIETKPGEYYKIKSGRNIFVYEVNEIDVIKKEIVEDSIESIDISNKTWSLSLGFAVSRLSSVLSLTKDFRLGEHSSIFITFDPFLATAYGLGYSYEQNYHNSGMFFNFSSGSYYEYYSDNYEPEITLSIGYQSRNKKEKPNFFRIGILYNSYEDIDDGYDYSDSYFAPVLSWEKSF